MRPVSIIALFCATVARVGSGDMATIPSGAAPASAPAGGNVILDENCYWRYHFTWGPARISPEKMKAEGAKWMSEKVFDRLRQVTVDRLKRQGRPTDDWTSQALYVFPWRANGDSDDVVPYLTPFPPPQGWEGAEFDDAGWTCQRRPYLMGKFIVGRVWTLEDRNLSVRQGCYRTWFNLPDTAQSGPLTLELSYAGGARVLVNGREILRRHLPQGALEPETPGEAYPPEAYLAGEGELTGKPQVVPDLIGRFEDCEPTGAASEFRRYRGRSQSSITISRAGWDRIQAARNRATGPVVIPPEALRGGPNLLAVEFRSSQLHPIAMQWQGWEANDAWMHGAITGLRLTSARPIAGAGTKLRPPGVQVWAEDVHRRMFNGDFAPPGPGASRARLVSPRNATCAAQIVVGTDRPLSGLKASVSELTSGGKALGAKAQVFYEVARPASRLSELGENRGRWSEDPLCDSAPLLLARYGPVEQFSRLAGEPLRRLMTAEMGKLQFFDQLASTAPQTVPADACQPVWVSFRVPADAAAGVYDGKVTVRADGLAPIELPLRLEVLDWRAPDARDFRAFLALEQSPYGVAKAYKTDLWSPEHLRLVEASLAQLGRVGNKWLNIPVLCYTEFGNGQDTLIRWSRPATTTGSAGDFRFDYKILDQYLDLAVKHWGKPQVINFVINHPGHPGDNRFKESPIEVLVKDEATGAEEMLNIGKLDDAQRKALWQQFGKSLLAHMKDKGLEKSVYWGHPWDGEGDPKLPAIMAEVAPEVKWTRGGHGHNPDKTFTAVSTIYGSKIWLGLESRRGWSRPEIHLLNPRHAGTVMCCFGNATPFAYRLVLDRALVGGGRGIARLGADYWGPIFLSGFKGQPWLVGMPCNYLLWPGPNGAESSQRFEVLLEGVQEAEARIFLEQALDRAEIKARKELGDKITQVLRTHSHETMLLPPGSSSTQLGEYSTGWQDRSRRLYQMAAQVSALPPRSDGKSE